MAALLDYIRQFEQLGRGDVGQVGGKNASLGELVCVLGKQGINVPAGFATTAAAYRFFVAENKLGSVIETTIADWRQNKIELAVAGNRIRRAFLAASIPAKLGEQILAAYKQLSSRYGDTETDVAVRSSATAEDLPEASFAGQQESFLNIQGHGALLDACLRCYASLFTDRAIAYRERLGYEHAQIALSIGIQKMVRSDQAGAGVIFTIDTETGFPDVVVVTAGWGLGENVVKGLVTPDEYLVFKTKLNNPNLRPILGKTLGSKEKRMIYAGDGRSVKNVDTTQGERQSWVLSDDEILLLSRWAQKIEKHYGVAMDIEWAKDGRSGQMFIVQARPETVEARKGAATMTSTVVKTNVKPLVKGIAVGQGVATGRVRVVANARDMTAFASGEILVASMTDPDWVPLMRRAAAIVTDHGGRTCHAAIVARELGLPAVVGTSNATQQLQTGQEVTVACAVGSTGAIYAGKIEHQSEVIELDKLPSTRTQIMINIGSPDSARAWWRLPSDGIGLARMEFLISNWIKVHPMALLHPDHAAESATAIRELTKGYANGGDYFVERLAWGIGQIAAMQYPRPVIIRCSDFKTNEYADLIGGKNFEPHEENPMLGFRGASRYYHARYREGFELECRAIKRVREQIGLDNVVVMIPFCRTLTEADHVLRVMAEAGLKRGENGLKIYMMCEIPANVILAERFAERFDGFSIGSNDLTQLVLGVDRDSELLAELFDERDDAVKQMITTVIAKAHAASRPVGICGQAPSDHDGFAEFLVAAGIDSISLTPDRFVDVKKRVAAAENK